MNAAATLAESLPWPIRALGIPATFAAQDGSEHGLTPWDSIDVLSLAGSTEWKTSPAARRLAVDALERGLAVHMGRVNCRRRLRHRADLRLHQLRRHLPRFRARHQTSPGPWPG